MKVHWSIPVVTAGAILGGALYFSVPANADTSDDVFLSVLARYDVPEPAGASAAIADAHTACAVMRQGVDPVAVAGVLYRQIAAYTPLDAGHFVGAAIGSYCPDQAPKITGGGSGGGGIQTGTVI